jgi:parallel beta-helix repeat protein
VRLKKKIIFLAYITILGSLALLVTSIFDSNCSPYAESEDISFYNLKRGGSWDLVGINILVDDSDNNYNWTKTVTENDWCIGSGIPEDPYIIENITINSLKVGSCIEIKNSNSSFIIRNCTFSQSGIENVSAGIKFNNTVEGEIYNCSFSFNDIAILLENCENITISKSKIIDNNDVGIIVHYTNNSIISDNEINNNIGIGVHLINSNDNTISGNEGTANTGINGAFLHIIYSNSNTIKNNYIKNNKIGILIENSLFNVIYGNYLILNGQNALNIGTSNQWDSGVGSIGNFWSDYEGYDFDDNGIGDTTHNFGTGVDSFPIYIAPPELNIISPEFLKSYFNPPKFEIEISLGGNLDTLWYYIQNSIVSSNYIIEYKTNVSSLKTGFINSEAWNNVENGHIYIIFRINDTYGREFGIAVEIMKISKPPDFSVPILSGIVLTLIATSLILIRKKLGLKDISKMEQESIFKIKKSILIFGKRGGRLELDNITEETGENKNIIIPVIKNMIQENEIDAEYFKSSKSIVFNRQTIGNEIDKLVEEYQKWEEEKKGKKI